MKIHLKAHQHRLAHLALYECSKQSGGLFPRHDFVLLRLLLQAVFSDEDLGDWQGFGLAVQAYQKRAIFVIEWLTDLATRVGRKMMVRLVKGAYWDTEIKTTQQDGLDHYPVFTRKATTDVSYKACAIKMLECVHQEQLFCLLQNHEQ